MPCPSRPRRILGPPPAGRPGGGPVEPRTAPSRGRPRAGSTLGRIGLAAAALALAGAGCATRVREPAPVSVERALLERRIEELEDLLTRRAGGPLIPFEQGLVVIHQDLLHDLLRAALPYETVVAGQFRFRVLAATVACEEGAALIRLTARASLAAQPESTVFADAIVYGALREFDLERDESVLRGRVAIVAFEFPRVRLPGGESPDLRLLMRDLVRLRLAAFENVDYAFDVPVRLVHDVVLPEYRAPGALVIPSSRIPVRASVIDVIPLESRLWIPIRLEHGHEAEPEPEAPSASAEAGDGTAAAAAAAPETR